MSDDCKSCDTCKHEFEAKPKPRTAGEKWAERDCCELFDDSKHCKDGICSQCSPKLAQAYNIGDSAGYARGTYDERARRAHYEVMKNKHKPKPAMTVEDWWNWRVGFCTYCEHWDSCPVSSDRYVKCKAKTLKALANYRNVNQGRIITGDER